MDPPCATFDIVDAELAAALSDILSVAADESCLFRSCKKPDDLNWDDIPTTDVEDGKEVGSLLLEIGDPAGDAWGEETNW